MEAEAWALQGIGRVNALTGEPEQALRQLNLSLELVRERGVVNGVQSMLITRAISLRMLGRYEEASVDLDSAEAKIKHYSAWGYAPLLWRERADLARVCGDREAERDALEQLVRCAEAAAAWGHRDTALQRLTASAAP